ncbi:DMT family transporter [Hoeflea olei]|uniref:EamA domain-containing protein n=1 Tax=Hoeflea olei TaxID=1480615 RepID=A0A1C1YU03_9HYPH|nr:DMT family transporter [Hoeflea olei]OCW56877.1 hypothetical protein AWJ14_06860 [Hoeflea olei]
MTGTIATDRSANLKGSGWMILAMGLFALEDALVKVAALNLPVGQILIMFGLGGALVFALVARLQGQALFVRAVASPAMGLRALAEITGRLFYVLAIAAIPLSAATVILQATPLVVVAGAALGFGEKVGWKRWSAICLGLVGVVVIVQPGTDSFSALSMLAIVGMLGFAGRDLASRAAPVSLGTSLLGFYGFLAMLAAGVIYALWQGVPFVPPGTDLWIYLLLAVLTGVLAYASLMKAMRTGEVSAVTPFRYTRLLFGILLGVVLFGEALTPSMLVGSALICVSGVFILRRGKSATLLKSD